MKYFTAFIVASNTNKVYIKVKNSVETTGTNITALFSFNKHNIQFNLLIYFTHIIFPIYFYIFTVSKISVQLHLIYFIRPYGWASN